LFIVINVSLSKSIEKAYDKMPVFNETVIYTINESGLKVKGESFEATMPWNKFDYIWAKGDFLVFLQTATFGNIIPKRNLSSGQLEQLLQYAHTANVKIKGSKK
jgi:hypothetical protein